MKKYVVKDEHTLGYLIPEMPDYMGVLRCSVLRGGTHAWEHGPVLTAGSKIRPATEKDFEDFRVQLPPDFNS